MVAASIRGKNVAERAELSKQLDPEAAHDTLFCFISLYLE